MTAEDYAERRRSLAYDSIDYGVGGVRLEPADELAEAQEGYGGDDWKDSWLVIGAETTTGDPIFIDLAEDGAPVYTAMHGEGAWDPEPIADSLDGFLRGLDAFAQVAEGRHDPVSLDDNPLPADDREAYLDAVREANPGLGDTEFWELLVGDDEEPV